MSARHSARNTRATPISTEGAARRQTRQTATIEPATESGNEDSEREGRARDVSDEQSVTAYEDTSEDADDEAEAGNNKAKTRTKQRKRRASTKKPVMKDWTITPRPYPAAPTHLPLQTDAIRVVKAQGIMNPCRVSLPNRGTADDERDACIEHLYNAVVDLKHARTGKVPGAVFKKVGGHLTNGNYSREFVWYMVTRFFDAMVAFYIEGCPLSKYEDPSWDLEKDQHYSRKSESNEEIFMYSKETGKFDKKTRTGLKTYHDMPILTCVALVAHGARLDKNFAIQMLDTGKHPARIFIASERTPKAKKAAKADGKRRQDKAKGSKGEQAGDVISALTPALAPQTFENDDSA